MVDPVHVCALVNRAVDAFVNDERNKDHSLPSRPTLLPLADRAAAQMLALERSVGVVSERIDLVWVVSGPGSWFNATKNDRYAIHPWARWMDRARIETGIALARAVAAARLRTDALTISDMGLSKAAPLLLYNGRPDEVETFLCASRRTEFGLPQGCSDHTDGWQDEAGTFHPIETTTDNVRSFRWRKFPVPGEEPVSPPREIAIVSHPPQLVRLLYILNKWRTVPEESVIRLFPVHTPIDGRDEYVVRDTQSLLAHIFLLQDAADTPYPAVV